MLGHGLNIWHPSRGGGEPPIITQTVAPSFGPYVAGNTPAGVYTAGTYASTAGTISSAVASWTVNGVSAPGSTVLAGGDVVGLSVLVTDSAANTRTFGYGASTTAATAPAAFTVGQWSLGDSPSVGGDTLVISITALPADGGSSITALQYRVNGGTAVTMSGTGTGTRQITVPALASANVEIRAVNAVGNSAWSDTKAATPTTVTATIVAILGQSQPEYLLNTGSFYRQIAQPTVPVANVRAITQSAQGGPLVDTLVNATSVAAGQVNPWVANLAVWLNTVLPGQEVILVDLCEPGTGRGGLMNDADTDRNWSDLEATVSYVRTNYGEIDHIVECWQANDNPTAKAHCLEWAPFYAGQRFGGGAFTLGTANPDSVSNPSKTVDHCLWDATAAADAFGRGLFKKAATKLHLVGWPAFDSASSTDEALNFSTSNSGGSLGASTQLDRPAKDQYLAFLEWAQSLGFGGNFGPSSHVADTDDGTHPDETVPDGQILMGWAYAVSIANILGASISEPVISSAAYGPDGAYADFTVTGPAGGYLTTLRAFRGEAAPTVEPPHYQPVVGFEIRRVGDTEAQRRPVWKTSETGRSANYRGTVTFTGNVIRVTPEVPFAEGDVVDFLRGAGAATLLNPRDTAAALYKNMPIWHVPSLYDNTALYPLEGIAVRPQPPAFVVANVTGPTISSTSPADNATGVAATTSPTITFNEAVAFGTGNITLRQNISGTWSDAEVFSVTTEVGTGNGQVSISGAVLTINPTATLVDGREYAIRIDATAIDDLSGNSFAGIANDTTFSFTAAVSDVTAPTISSTSPADNASGVAAGTSPTITFSEAVAFGTGNITLRQNISGTWSDAEVFSVTTEVGTGNGQVSISGAVLTINPTTDLTAGREYAIRIDATAIDDLAGNSFAGVADDTTVSFTVASGTPTVFHTQSGTGPYFVDPVNVPANTTRIEWKAKIYATGNPGAIVRLFAQESTGCDLYFGSTGAILVNIEDGAGTAVVFAQNATENLTTGAWVEYAFDVDHTAGTANVTRNGVNIFTRTWTPTASPTFQTAREISFFATSAGSNLMPSGWQVEYAECYFTTGGTRTLRKRIEGNAATVNADAWKLGGNAT